MTDASIEILFLLRPLSAKGRTNVVGTQFADFLSARIAFLHVFLRDRRPREPAETPPQHDFLRNHEETHRPLLRDAKKITWDTCGPQDKLENSASGMRFDPTRTTMTSKFFFCWIR